MELPQMLFLLFVFLLFVCLFFWMLGFHIPLHNEQIQKLITDRYILPKDYYDPPPIWKLIIVLIYCGPLAILIAIINRIVEFIRKTTIKEAIIQFLTYEDNKKKGK